MVCPTSFFFRIVLLTVVLLILESVKWILHRILLGLFNCIKSVSQFGKKWNLNDIQYPSPWTSLSFIQRSLLSFISICRSQHTDTALILLDLYLIVSCLGFSLFRSYYREARWSFSTVIVYPLTFLNSLFALVTFLVASLEFLYNQISII